MARPVARTPSGYAHPHCTMVRLAAISPDELDAEQKPLYDDMSQGIQTDFKGFVNV